MADYERNLKKGMSPITAAENVKLSTAKYYNAIYQQLVNSTLHGAEQAKRDMETKLGAELAEPTITGLNKQLEFLPPHVKKAIKTQAKTQVAVHEVGIDKVIAFGAMTGEENGLAADVVLFETQQKLDDFVASNQVKNAAGTMVVQTYNRGRAGWFFKSENLKKIQAFQYSAILDQKTTDICMSLDGKIFLPNDPAGAAFSRPPVAGQTAAPWRHTRRHPAASIDAEQGMTGPRCGR